MRLGISLMGVAKIMNPVDQGYSGCAQLLDQSWKARRALGIETEMNIKDVEGMVMVRDPSRVQHRRRPPLRRRSSIRHRRVGQPKNTVVAVEASQMSHVHVACGTDATRIPSVDTSHRLPLL
jgi:hypothetical protein